MTGNFWPSAFVAAVFGLHPVHVESVAWLSERKDVLSTFFWLLSLLAYVEYVRCRQSRWYWWSCAALALGLMSKPMLVTAPFLLLLLDVWPLQRASVTFWRRLVEKTPLIMLVLASSVITYFAQQQGHAMQHYSMGDRLANAVTAYVRYIGKTCWPTHLSPLYPYHPGMWSTWQVVGAVALLLAITAGVILLRRYSYLAVGWLWFLGTLVPVLGLVPVGYQSMADRYLYMPMTGLLVMLAWGAADIGRRWPVLRTGLVGAASAALLICCWLTPEQVAKWKNSHTLFAHAIEQSDRNHVMHLNLGTLFHQEGELDKAVEHYQAALQIAPDFAKAHNSLGTAYRDQNELELAIRCFRQAIRCDREYGDVYVNLGMALQASGRPDEAVTCLHQALDLDPEDPDKWHSLGTFQMNAGNLPAAIQQYRTALKFDPNHFESLTNLGATLAASGDLEGATSCFRAAAKLRPANDDVLANLGIALHRQGQRGEAETYLRRALRINPNQRKAGRELERLLGK
jgi:Tfp pilus assembly protein PilF